MYRCYGLENDHNFQILSLNDDYENKMYVSYKD